jgi:hypothetical protein
MSSPLKKYKIIVDSKHFVNMKGFSPAEVAKKAAGKILEKSNRIIQFSMIEIKNGKIRNYKAHKENLIRPYKKNGKLITCRIIVKKITKHTGGGEAEILSQIYEKEEFTEEDREKIKAEMFIENIFIDETKTHYDPYNLTVIMKKLITQGNEAGFESCDFLELGENDPIFKFFPKLDFEISFDLRNLYGGGKMELKFNEKYYINYEFTGNEDIFKLHIYNLDSCRELEYSEGMAVIQRWENYYKFLCKLYPDAEIYINFYPERFFSSSSRNRNRLNKLKYQNFKKFFKEDQELSNNNYNNNNY